jgi:hypothetical protein
MLNRNMPQTRRTVQLGDGVSFVFNHYDDCVGRRLRHGAVHRWELFIRVYKRG